MKKDWIVKFITIFLTIISLIGILYLIAWINNNLFDIGRFFLYFSIPVIFFIPITKIIRFSITNSIVRKTTIWFFVLYLLYTILNHTTTVQFITKIHPFSLLGLWFTGIGIIGKEKLEKWENKYITLIIEEKIRNIIDYITEKISRLCFEKLLPYIVFSLLLGVFFLILPSLFQIAPSIERIILIIGFLLFILPFPSLLLYIIIFSLSGLFGIIVIIPIEISIYPYRIVSKFSEEQKFERMFVFIGLLLGSIGILTGT